MRALLLVMDGLGDIRTEKGTPLEEAKTPNMDRLADLGSTGFFIPYKKGTPVGSDIGHLSLFGYGEEDYNGRGPLEALGYGIDMKEGSIAFRANLGTVESNKIIDRRAGRISTKEHEELAKFIDGIVIDGIKVRYIASAEHRGILVLEGEGLSDKITDTDIHSLGEIVKCKPLSKEAEFTANVINKLSIKAHELLSNNELNIRRKKEGKPPGNYLLLRGGGKHTIVKTKFKEKYGLSALAVAGKPLYKGVAKHVGMDISDSPKGDSLEELIKKAELSNNNNYDFVFMHVKATDTAGHDGKWEEKKEVIERVDKIIPLLDKFDVIAITGDHSTPCSYKAHSGHPVPLLIYGKNVRRDETKKFSEYECMKGSLNLRRDELMLSIVNYLEKAKLVGN